MALGAPRANDGPRRLGAGGHRGFAWKCRTTRAAPEPKGSSKSELTPELYLTRWWRANLIRREEVVAMTKAFDRHDRALVQSTARALAQAWETASSKRDQRIAQSTVDALSKAGLLRQSRAVTGVVKRVLRDEGGQITSIVESVEQIREDLVGSVGAFTAAAFTIAAAQLTRATGTWRGFFPAAVFGGLLLGFLTFRGGFRRGTEPEPPSS